jgi:hypothetical protein
MIRSVVLLAAVLLAAPLLGTMPASPAHAQAERQEQPSPSERLQEGAAAIVDGLRMLMDQLQSYQPPEVLPNGDIIIRRRPPAGGESEAPRPDAPRPDAPRPDAPPSSDNKPRPL